MLVKGPRCVAETIRPFSFRHLGTCIITSFLHHRSEHQACDLMVLLYVTQCSSLDLSKVSSDDIPACLPASHALAWLDWFSVYLPANQGLAWLEWSSVPANHALVWSDWSSVPANHAMAWSDWSSVPANHAMAWSDWSSVPANHALAWSDWSSVPANHAMAWSDWSSVPANHALAWSDWSSVPASHALAWSDWSSVPANHAMAWSDWSLVCLPVNHALLWSDPQYQPTMHWRDRIGLQYQRNQIDPQYVYQPTMHWCDQNGPQYQSTMEWRDRIWSQNVYKPTMHWHHRIGPQQVYQRTLHPALHWRLMRWVFSISTNQPNYENGGLYHGAYLLTSYMGVPPPGSRHVLYRCHRMGPQHVYQPVFYFPKKYVPNVSSNQLCTLSHDTENSLKHTAAAIRLSGSPLPPVPIRGYNGLRGEDMGPFDGQWASASNFVMVHTW